MTTTIQPYQGRAAVGTPGTPVPLVSTLTLVDSVEIHARKNVTTANSGAVYIGFSKAGGSNFRVLLPGESFTMTAPAGLKINLQNFWVDGATAADAVTYTAQG